MAEFAFDIMPDGTAAGTTDTDGVFVYNQNYAQESADKLIELFKKPRNIEAMKIVGEEIQELEDAIYATMLAFLLDNATDHRLDLLGAWVGEKRQGRSDNDYRAAIRVRVLVNRSNGRAEELIDISEGLVPSASIGYREVYPAAIELSFSTLGTTTLRTVYMMLRQAKGGGVRLLVTYGGVMGAVDGDPAGGTMGAVDGNPLGFLMGGGT